MRIHLDLPRQWSLYIARGARVRFRGSCWRRRVANSFRDRRLSLPRPRTLTANHAVLFKFEHHKELLPCCATFYANHARAVSPRFSRINRTVARTNDHCGRGAGGLVLILGKDPPITAAASTRRLAAAHERENGLFKFEHPVVGVGVVRAAGTHGHAGRHSRNQPRRGEPQQRSGTAAGLENLLLHPARISVVSSWL